MYSVAAIKLEPTSRGTLSRMNLQPSGFSPSRSLLLVGYYVPGIGGKRIYLGASHQALLEATYFSSIDAYENFYYIHLAKHLRSPCYTIRHCAGKVFCFPHARTE